MPRSFYQSQATGEWDVLDTAPITSEGDWPDEFVAYQYMIWRPAFRLTFIPNHVSRDIRHFGNKHYLGEIAYLNFGGIVKTEYLQYEFQQGEMSLGLPVPLLDRSPNISFYSNFSLLINSPLQRARSLSWSLAPGVEFMLSIDWITASQPYNPDNNFHAMF